MYTPTWSMIAAQITAGFGGILLGVLALKLGWWLADRPRR